MAATGWRFKTMMGTRVCWATGSTVWDNAYVDIYRKMASTVCSVNCRAADRALSGESTSPASTTSTPSDPMRPAMYRWYPWRRSFSPVNWGQ